MTVKSKLLIALSVILVTAFVATSAVNYTVTREAVREELLNSSLPLTGKNIYSEIHAGMMAPILVSSSMANDAFLKEWIADGEGDLERIQKYLGDIKRKYRFLTTFFVSADTDRYYYPDGILKEVNPREPRDVWYYAFTRMNKEYDLNVDLSMQDNDKLTIFVNYRVEDDRGRLLGVVGVGVNMDSAIRLLHKTKQQYGREVYLVDQDGWVQVHSDRSLIQKAYATETEGLSNIAGKLLVPRDKAVSFEYDRNGSHILLSSRYIPEFEWYLIVEQDEDEALTTARHNLVRTLAVGVSASVLIIFLCMVTINHFQARLEAMAKTDPLTGVANRHALEERFSLSAYKAERYDEPFSIVIVDLDNFKDINDRLGHLAGDDVLRSTADSLQQTIRPSDIVARWGGDEFLILMDGTREDAHGLAQRLRVDMAHSSREVVVLFSCGIAQYQAGDDLSSLTHRADRALYQAKAEGGDSVVSD